jgi:hypothetical protein
VIPHDHHSAIRYERDDSRHRLYAAMVKAHTTVSVFRDRNEADAWLSKSV